MTPFRALELRPSLWRSLALTLTLLIAWQLMYGYHGIIGDGAIYAFQALARLHPNLTTDLYLSNDSQDNFTALSRPYAWCVDFFGLESAARTLTLLCSLWLYAALYGLCSVIAGRRFAWLGVTFSMIAGGNFGSSNVFRIFEPFFTARLPAEAMIVSALLCFALRRRWLAVALNAAAIFVHPLMALPGVLLLACWWLSLRVSIAGAIAGIALAALVAIVATTIPQAGYGLVVIDPVWLEVVRERSQFLLMQMWSVQDWDVNLRPFFTLWLAALVIRENSVSKLSGACALVAVAGLLVTLIGSFVGPVAILIQGQPWRWVWPAVLLSTILAPRAAGQLWRRERFGKICGMLLMSAWLLPGIYGTLFMGLAVTLWLVDERLDLRRSTHGYITISISFAIAFWLLHAIWPMLSGGADAGHPSGSNLQAIFRLKAPAFLFAMCVWAVVAYRTAPVRASACVALAGLAVFLLPAAFKQTRALPAPSDFAAWKSLIPPTDTVLVVPAQNTDELVWFTLKRPSYLSLDQSAGVIFSRRTALEVRRRSSILLPVEDPDWKILTRLSQSTLDHRTQAPATRPLTVTSLIHICADPLLGFVVSPEILALNGVSHDRSGAWKGWRLYDCRDVRTKSASVE